MEGPSTVLKVKLGGPRAVKTLVGAYSAQLVKSLQPVCDFVQISTGAIYMACSGCNGPFFLVLSLGVVGSDTVSTSAPWCQ
jgi:hypothetical protein